ncbi:FAD-dependent oxidoreductase [Clostridium sp.]|uniref:FAD-dependent oxidoreductase n=1 Tax=Clostridium sp. TaxID=1506 RepID=UPI003D6D5F67
MIYDVIIIGGGTAGALAAIASGRMGMKTLLIESNGYVGGTATGGIVSPMMSNHKDDYISDLNNEIILKLKETGDGFGNWFNPEVLKYVLERLIVESGVKIRYYSNAFKLIRKEKLIHSILVQSKSGVEEFKGKIFIDSTGDADISRLAGIKVCKGNLNGLNQPISLRFIMSNINVSEFSSYVEGLGQKHELDVNEFSTAHTKDGVFPLQPIFEEAVKNGELQEEDARYFQCFSIPGRSSDLTFNCPEIFQQLDGSSVEDLTTAQIIGKQKIFRYVKFLKTLPGFKNSYLSLIAPLVGVRESVRIQGEYILTGKDILTYKKFDNRIMSSNYPVDIHNLSNDDTEYIEKLRNDVSNKEAYYDIPWDIMICSEIDNLIVAGRCVSTDFIAQSAIRIQNICRGMGEAAGYMAYMSIINNKQVKQLDNLSFQTLLKQKGFR